MTDALAPPLEIPHLLKEAVKNQSAVIVLGAGCSKECNNSSSQRPPDGEQLRNILAKKFLGTENETRDLMTVAELAISSGVGQPIVFDEIEKNLRDFQPSDAHRLLAQFKWRGLATTNYDTLVEEAYSQVKARLQQCLPFVKDTEPYEARLRQYNDPVAYLKLHGCLTHRLDPDIPLVLSHEHYARVSQHRKHLLQRLQHWASESTVIFIGYKMSDPHIRKLIYEIQQGARPHWYIVTPTADAHDIRFWATQNVTLIQSTFGAFMRALDHAVPQLYRSLSTSVFDPKAPYRNQFRTNTTESEALRQGFEVDFEYIHGGISVGDVSPASFYSGHDSGWSGILKKYDFARKAGEDLLYKVLSPEATQKTQRLYLLVGSAGSGKSVALKRAAFDAATSFGELVIWLRPNGVPRFDLIEELFVLTGKVPMLFIDSISLYADEVLRLLKDASNKNIPLDIIASEREADWSSYCSELEDSYQPEIAYLRHLSEREANSLIDLLERHKCLGVLSELSRKDQIAAFMNEDRSDRQLLVALHELTQGKPFEEIILAEYRRISPEPARQLYLDIATMHQFGSAARAGAISRISGIRFVDFQDHFFEPLTDIVRVQTDKFTGDKIYRTRHAHVAAIVFGQACPTDLSKATQLIRIMEGIDAGYSSDQRILDAICKGRALAQMFQSIEHGRMIFETSHRISNTEAYLFQQHAIMEMIHKDGSLENAEYLALKARSLDQKNHIYLHTLAEIARRKAVVETTKVKKDYLRNQARKFLDEIRYKDSRRDLSYCKLLVDEVLELDRELSENPKDHETLAFDRQLSEAVERLQKARQDFPEEPDVGSVEATLWKQLGQSKKAVDALALAIKARPRSASIYTRLSRIYREKGDIPSSTKTLRAAIGNFPNDKNTHLQLALALVEEQKMPNINIEQHLRMSFTVGDNNFDARFCYAEYLFWDGRTDAAFAIFDDLHKKADVSYRTQVPKMDDEITSQMGTFFGTVSTKRPRFFFIKTASVARPIFAHFSSLNDCGYDELDEGQKVKFRLRFNREGPVAISVFASQN